MIVWKSAFLVILTSKALKFILLGIVFDSIMHLLNLIFNLHLKVHTVIMRNNSARQVLRVSINVILSRGSIEVTS